MGRGSTKKFFKNKLGLLYKSDNKSSNEETKIELTNDMMKIIQNPGPLHLKLIENILESTKISFEESQGFVNAKDFQIQCLFEYEKLRSRGIKKKKGGASVART